jgi:hypothetical protein
MSAAMGDNTLFTLGTGLGMGSMHVWLICVAHIVLEGVCEKPQWVYRMCALCSQGFDNIALSEHNCGLSEFTRVHLIESKIKV